MKRSSAAEEEAFLHAEACELAVLSKEDVSCSITLRKPKSVLHPLSVELSVPMGLDDRARLDRLVSDAIGIRAVIVEGTSIREDGRDVVDPDGPLPGHVLRGGRS